MTAVNEAVQMFMRGRGYVIIGSWNLQRDAAIQPPAPLLEAWILLELNDSDNNRRAERTIDAEQAKHFLDLSDGLFLI